MTPLTNKFNTLSLLLLSIVAMTILGCLPEESKDKKKENNKIIIREEADASSLHPLTLRDAVGFQTALLLYQPLVNIDYETSSMVGVLAEEAPTIDSLPEGNFRINYRIRSQARFDSGRKISGQDVLFSMKLYMAPFAFNRGNRSYYEFIDSIEWSAEDSLKISIYVKQLNSRTVYTCGDFFILPYEHFDPERVLTSFSLGQLRTFENSASDEKLSALEKRTDSLSKSSSSFFLSGSGPYALAHWEKGQRILLKKKSDWWGDALDISTVYFKNNAEELQIEIIADETTAINALKAGEIDLIQGLGPKNYEKLFEENSRFHTYSASKQGYQCIGFNTNHPLLQDKNVRQAIALICPTQTLIDQVFYGHADRSSVPYIQDSYKSNDPYVFNAEKATELLEKSMWKDIDDDGILEKTIEGEETELRLEYLFNSSSTARGSVGMILKQEAKKIGIDIDVQSVEWSVYLQRLRNAETQLYYYGAQSPPLPPDFRSLFHSSSANGGRNFAQYQNPSTDALINAINQSINAEERNTLIQEFYQLIHEDVPYYFILVPHELIATSNAVKGMTPYPTRPYYWAAELYK